MRNTPVSLLIVLLMTLVIGLLSPTGWPGYLMGAVYAFCLWGILFFGSFASSRRGYVAARTLATAAAIALPLGYGLVLLGGGNGSWWAPAIIVVGLILPATTSTTARSGAAEARREG